MMVYYQLAPKLSHLEVTEEVWRGLSAKDRVARIALEDEAGASACKVKLKISPQNML